MCDRPLILTGFMGSGKSTVGKKMALLLETPFFDLDEVIVNAVGCSINDIFSRDGEAVFRELESFHLQKLLSSGAPSVIATGGGAVIASVNRTIMRKFSVVVNLKVSLEQVLVRLKGNGDRPLLAGDDAASHAARLLSEREQFYADADIRIDTNGKSVEDVAAEILCSLKGL